jgi:hypothetical protein
LANYVIDSPTAYQLYYGADIPSLAIDDPAALAQSPREIQPADTLESVKKLSELRQKMVQKGVDEKDDIIKILDYMGWLETAHAEAESQELVDLIVSRDELYGGMAKALAPIRNQGLSGYVDFLDKQHTAYESERKTYEQALVRDKTMAGFINYHFRSELKDRLPIAFIGSFHTPGIIAKLDSDVGYVVLEPQRVADATREEIERFYDAILDTKKLIQNLKAKRKGPVTRAPEVFSESVAILTPQVTNVGAPPELSKFLGAEPAAQIMNSIRSNSSIGDARVILADAGGAGKGPPDVPRLPGIFGSFHPGGGGPGGRGGSSGRGDGGSPPGSRPSGASGGGDGPMFVLYPKEKGKWEDLGERERWSRDRLSFLEKMILIPPFGRNEKIPKKMYVEQIGDKVYWIYYEPKTDAYYVLEGNEKINAMRILNLENNKNYIFHQNISVNEMQRKDKRS